MPQIQAELVGGQDLDRRRARQPDQQRRQLDQPATADHRVDEPRGEGGQDEQCQHGRRRVVHRPTLGVARTDLGRRRILGSMSRLPLLALLLPVAGVLAGGAGQTSYAAAGETCQGRPATIVGAPGSDSTEPRAHDVIVDGRRVHRRCRRRRRPGLRHRRHRPPGRRRGLPARATTRSTRRRHGESETRGSAPASTPTSAGPGDDDVNAGAGEDDGETISTGDGYDTVVSGRQGHPMNDVIDLGDGVDYALLRGLPGTGSVDGGAGRDFVQLYDRTRASVDHRRPQADADGRRRVDVPRRDRRVQPLRPAVGVAAVRRRSDERVARPLQASEQARRRRPGRHGRRARPPDRRTDPVRAVPRWRRRRPDHRHRRPARRAGHRQRQGRPRRRRRQRPAPATSPR